MPACGSSSGGNDSTNSGVQGTCGIRADVAGGTSIRFTGNNDAACATQHSFDTGLDATFIGIDNKGTLELTIDDIAEGEIGSDYPTRLSVMNAADERWQSSTCLTSISEHHLVEVEDSEIGELRQYQVSGEGTCPEPLEPLSAGADPVTLASFAFRARFTWRD